jgi:hypothetical protein
MVVILVNQQTRKIVWPGKQTVGFGLKLIIFQLKVGMLRRPEMV